MLRPMRLSFVVAAVALSACTVELQHDLSEDDANDIYVLLQNNGIEAKKLKEEGGNVPRYIISVGKQDVSAAAQLLRAYALPRPYVDGLSVFKKMKGMIPTQTEERAMFIEALGGEISNSLNRIPGVLEARVIVMIPETNDLTQPEKKPMPSVSVFIKYRGNASTEDKPPVSENEVKEFVATAVPELRKDSVTVLMKKAAAMEAEQDPDTRYQTVMGLRMTKQSAEQFKVLVGVGAFIVLAMAGLTGFAFVRKPNGNGNGTRPPPRTKTGTGGTPPPAAD